MRSRFGLLLLSAGLTLALSAGCGGSPSGPPVTAPFGSVQTPQTQRETSFLYVADNPYGVGVVYIFPYPNPNRDAVKAITRVGYVLGPCAAPSGKVWVPAYDHHGAVVFEFNRGETKPIAQIEIPSGDGAGECAFDSATGNLAVLGKNAVDVFKGAVQGKPLRYSIPGTTPIACAFDTHGNLFVDGAQGSEFFLLYELAAGQHAFTRLTLDKPFGFPGGLAWDGRYVAIATGGNGIRPVIYRFTVAGTTAKVVQAVHPKGLQAGAWFAVADGDVVGTSGSSSSGESKLNLWPYPGGGNWIWRLDGSFETPGLTISPAK